MNILLIWIAYILQKKKFLNYLKNAFKNSQLTNRDVFRFYIDVCLLKHRKSDVICTSVHQLRFQSTNEYDEYNKTQNRHEHKRAYKSKSCKKLQLKFKT